MFAFVRASEGLLIAHLILAASFLVGSMVFPWCDRRRAAGLSSSDLMMRVVATCAFGLAVFGFAALLLAAAGLFRPYIYYPLVLVGAFCSATAFGASPLSRRFWMSRLDIFARSWGLSTLPLYVLLVILAFPAIVGNMGGSDPVGYHLVYADEWAKAGRLTIDPFLRLPFYASNFLLLYAALMAAGGAVFVNFLSWATALLTTLGIAATADCLLKGSLPRPHRTVISTALALSVVLSALYLRWMDTAYIDTAIGAFALASLMCIIIALREHRSRWLIVSTVVAGFLMGMKGSFFVLFPVYVIITAIAAHSLQLRRRVTLIVLVLLAACGSPWYLRNLILAGDPAPPLFNVAIYGRDGLMTAGEWKQDESDLSTPKTPAAIGALPFNVFFKPQSRYFREYGATALVLLLYVPAAMVLLLFALRRRIDPSLIVSATFVFLLVGYWVASSSLLRYASLFYPSLAVAVASSIAAVPLGSSKTLRAALALGSLLLIIPSPGSWEFYHDLAMNRFRYLPGSYLSDNYYLGRFSPGYAEARFVAHFVKKHHLGNRVYELGMRTQYYFERRGITAVGDWMGVGGYYRLYRALDARKAASYLRVLGIRSIVMARKGAISAMTFPLEEQLTHNGFCRVAMPQAQSGYRFYVSSRNICKADKAG